MKFDSIECHLTFNIGDDLCTYLYLSGLPNIISQLHYSSGKTTILYRLKLGKQLDFVIPTVGFNVETIDNRAGVTFSIYGILEVGTRYDHYGSTTYPCLQVRGQTNR